MDYKQTFENICQLLPQEYKLKRVKRGSTNRLRIVKGTHVLLDYPFSQELTEIDYINLTALVIREWLQNLA